MGKTGFQLSADLHDEDGTFQFGNLIFTFLGRTVRIPVFQLLGGDEEDIFRQDLFDVIIFDGHIFLGFFQGLIDFLDHLL